MSKPVDGVIAVTYRCDSRCNMCNIWQLAHDYELEPGEFGRLPESLRDVNITGGEPFLRDDLVEIVRIINERCRRPRMVVSTNGLQVKRIVAAAAELIKLGRSVGLAVSLDGIGEKHDEIRGVKGAFEKVLDTLKRLKALKYRNVRVAFTVQRDNVRHLGAVYDLSRQFGYQFTTSVAQNSEFYFSTDENQQVDPEELRSELRYVMRKELLSPSVKRWLRSYFYSGVMRFNAEGERILACRAGRDSFFMDPKGYVYPCLTLNRPVGNIREQSFESIWSSEESRKVRSIVDNCTIPCWMICTARTSIRRSPFKPALWILRNWIRILAGKGVS